MKQVFLFAAAAVMAASFVASPASAGKIRHHHRVTGEQSYRGSHALMPRRSPSFGNAAMSGNNGNSGAGDNSLGHIKGGNLGGGS